MGREDEETDVPLGILDVLYISLFLLYPYLFFE